MIKNIKKNLLIISIVIAIAPYKGYGMMAANKSKAQVAKEWAGWANSQIFSKFYKAESVRTAAIRVCMALACLADGTCSGSDMGLIALAGASAVTAISYNANNEQRSFLIPKQFNLLADGIATIASFDASALPITGSSLEIALRSLIGKLSLVTTAVACLPSSKAELDEYLEIIGNHLKK